MKKTISAILCMILAFTMLSAMPVSAQGLSNGVNNVSRTVTYIDPVTGKNPTGSGDSSFGRQVANNVLEKVMLVEKSNGKTYYTIGMGFMEYAGNGQKVNIKVQQNAGDAYESYQTVTATKVGSCDNGNCHHLKFEVPFDGARVCVSYNVEQMHRDVYFFIEPNLASAQPGNGNFGNRTDGASMREEFNKKIEEGKKDGTPDSGYNKNAGKGNSNNSGVVQMGGNHSSTNGQVADPNATTNVAQTTTNASTTQAQEAEAASAEEEAEGGIPFWVWIVVGIAAVIIIGAIIIFGGKKKA